MDAAADVDGDVAVGVDGGHGGVLVAGQQIQRNVHHGGQATTGKEGFQQSGHLHTR